MIHKRVDHSTKGDERINIQMKAKEINFDHLPRSSTPFGAMPPTFAVSFTAIADHRKK